MEDQESLLVYSFPRGRGEEYQMYLRKYNSKYYADVRIWFSPNPKDVPLRPTHKGVSFSVHQLPELSKGLERLLKAAEKLGTPVQTPLNKSFTPLV